MPSSGAMIVHLVNWVSRRRSRSSSRAKAAFSAAILALEITDVVAGAGVLDALIGVQKVIADLRAKTGLGLFLVLRGLGSLALFFLDARQAGPQHLDGR